jgi:uncharacterized protein with HEPN domain
MIKNHEIYLKHILDAIKQIKLYRRDIKNEDDFFEDRKTQDAVVRNLEIIGEAASKLPASFRAKHKEIQWRNIIDTRNLLIHGYFGVSYSAVWSIVENHIPLLEKQIKKVLKELKN